MDEQAPRATPGLRVVVALSSVLVLYSYLGALWLNRHGYSPATLVAIRDWISKPSGISQDFGVLGVSMLLMAAGFLVAQGTPVRRLLNGTVPALAVAAALGAAAHLLGGEPFLGLGWPVVVVVPATVLALATRRLPAAAGLALQLAVSGVLVLVGTNAPEAGQLAGFAPLFVLGQMLWQVRAARLSPWAGGLVSVGAFVIMLLTEHRYAEWYGYWYPVTALFALLIVMLALPSGQVAGETALVRWLSSRAVWLIGAGCALGWTVLGLGYQRLPLVVSMAAAVLVTGLAAEAGHRFVERPLGGAR
ncbi:hypothetical protein [Amycolatopsis benzoatilytica]|uniref:hypothetical protein n=1 Tax=Amycolatopsis benzoatilytica TaxID=346045 RepID=UPI00037677D6|nr:hypothetical protein [Amycolatopsis benzoatilytica]